jgi:hypothetical protein
MAFDCLSPPKKNRRSKACRAESLSPEHDTLEELKAALQDWYNFRH